MQTRSLAPILVPALLAASPTLAGEFGVREFPAVVTHVEIAASYSLPDRWAAAFGRPDRLIQGTGPVCVIGFDVDFPGPHFRERFGARTAVASVGACKQLRRGQRVKVQTMGLAGDLQVVSIELEGTWFSLPLMRQSAASDHPAVQACLKPVDEPRCAPLMGTKALGE